LYRFQGLSVISLPGNLAEEAGEAGKIFAIFKNQSGTFPGERRVRFTRKMNGGD
jgi:hypothetical protein